MDLGYLKDQKVSNFMGNIGIVTDIQETPDGSINLLVDFGEKTAKFKFFHQGNYVTKYLTFSDASVSEKVLASIEEHKKSLQCKESENNPAEVESVEVKPVVIPEVSMEPASEEDVIRFGKTHELYGQFSNFHGPTFYDGRQYKCSESAWQSLKTLDPAIRDQFIPLAGSSAKAKGRKVHLRPDWEQVKDQLMVDVCYAKFSQNEYLKELLLSTGNKVLIENTTGWHDNYWGDCQCPRCKNKPGLNHLGKALMQVRAMLRKDGAGEDRNPKKGAASKEAASPKNEAAGSNLQDLKAIFQDTLTYIEENETLKEKTQESVAATRFYGKDEPITLPENPQKDCKITVTQASTFEAARELSKKYPRKRIAVLNFASAASPGGGVLKGRGAQEESLCRASTLYPTLSTEIMQEQFYGPHIKACDNISTDDAIYSPGVVVCKTDTDFPKRVPENEFFTADVVTCAAPNLNPTSVKRFRPDAKEATTVSKEKLYEIHLKRAKRILELCALNKADIVVLGAFGCGVFKNDPEVVAHAMMDACKELKGYFDHIDFAIKVKKGGSKANYNAFASAIS